MKPLSVNLGFGGQQAMIRAGDDELLVVSRIEGRWIITPSLPSTVAMNEGGTSAILVDPPKED